MNLPEILMGLGAFLRQYIQKPKQIKIMIPREEELIMRPIRSFLCASNLCSWSLPIRTPDTRKQIKTQRNFI